MTTREYIEARLKDNDLAQPFLDCFDSEAKLRAEVAKLNLQVGEMRTALEQIATLAIELSDCDGDPGCPAGTMQRTAKRVLQQTEKLVVPMTIPCEFDHTPPGPLGGRAWCAGCGIELLRG